MSQIEKSEDIAKEITLKAIENNIIHTNIKLKQNNATKLNKDLAQQIGSFYNEILSYINKNYKNFKEINKLEIW